MKDLAGGREGAGAGAEEVRAAGEIWWRWRRHLA